MTRSRDEHLRALDGATAPDQWAEIVAAAHRPEVLATPTRHAKPATHRLLLAAAVVVVTAIGLGGIVVLVSGRGQDSGVATTPASPDTTQRTESIWGRTYELDQLRRPGVLSMGVGRGSTGVTLDLTRENLIVFTSCSTAEGPAAFDAELLRFTGTPPLVERVCQNGNGPQQQAMFSPIVALLQEGAEVTISDDRLTLSRRGVTADFVALD